MRFYLFSLFRNRKIVSIPVKLRLARMRLVAFSVCVFLNVMLFGMCSYMYLLWLQYWHKIWNRDKQPEEPSYEMSDFRRNEVFVEYYDDPVVPTKKPFLDKKKQQLDPTTPQTKNSKNAATRLNLLKTRTVTRLKQALFDDGGDVNVYGVGNNIFTSGHENLLCDLRSKLEKVRTLQKSDVQGTFIAEFLPEKDLFPIWATFNNCAVVSSAGSLRGSNLGRFIDENEVVLRFNNAPVAGYEKDVGSKTTVRVLNSQILAKKEFAFSISAMYENVSLMVWDPSNYTSTLRQWIENPEYNFTTSYIDYRKRHPLSNFHILDPSMMWILWNFIQGHTSSKIRRNPPSSGFLGIALLLPYCSRINVMEYVPSERATQRCHYYSKKMDALCTYGVWHPLAAEKLIALAMNVASDSTVFKKGYVSIPGYRQISC